MAHLAPYLSFRGSCRDAFTFYHGCLGGELVMQRFGDSPMADQLPADAQDGIMHASLTTPALTLFGSDAGGMGVPLVVGNHVSLCLNCESDEEITTLFARLSEGATVHDPLADMFWGAKFGALTDRFGMKWLFNYQKAPVPETADALSR